MNATELNSNEIFKKVEAKFYCQHRIKEIKKRIKSDASKYYVEQCSDCGWCSNGISKAKLSEEIKAIAPEYDENKQKQWSDAKSQYYQELKSEQNQAWFEEYNNYLSTPDWKQKRQKVLNRSNRVCEGCLEKTATQVHHKTYQNVGNEFLFELVALCGYCHDRIHGELNENNS